VIQYALVCSKFSVFINILQVCPDVLGMLAFVQQLSNMPWYALFL